MVYWSFHVGQGPKSQQTQTLGMVRVKNSLKGQTMQITVNHRDHQFYPKKLVYALQIIFKLLNYFENVSVEFSPKTIKS